MLKRGHQHNDAEDDEQAELLQAQRRKEGAEQFLPRTHDKGEFELLP